ncbi:unnamed protein product [Closterium sp. Naga37s-1]|nr:unnamed protein product [Closterium sp. Naga37s-1]
MSAPLLLAPPTRACSPRQRASGNRAALPTCPPPFARASSVRETRLVTVSGVACARGSSVSARGRGVAGAGKGRQGDVAVNRAHTHPRIPLNPSNPLLQSPLPPAHFLSFHFVCMRTFMQAPCHCSPPSFLLLSPPFTLLFHCPSFPPRGPLFSSAFPLLPFCFPLLFPSFALIPPSPSEPPPIFFFCLRSLSFPLPCTPFHPLFPPASPRLHPTCPPRAPRVPPAPAACPTQSHAISTPSPPPIPLRPSPSAHSSPPFSSPPLVAHSPPRISTKKRTAHHVRCISRLKSLIALLSPPFPSSLPLLPFPSNSPPSFLPPSFPLLPPSFPLLPPSFPPPSPLLPPPSPLLPPPSPLLPKSTALTQTHAFLLTPPIAFSSATCIPLISFPFMQAPLDCSSPLPSPPLPLLSPSVPPSFPPPSLPFVSPLPSLSFPPPIVFPSFPPPFSFSLLTPPCPLLSLLHRPIHLPPDPLFSPTFPRLLPFFPLLSPSHPFPLLSPSFSPPFSLFSLSFPPPFHLHPPSPSFRPSSNHLCPQFPIFLQTPSSSPPCLLLSLLTSSFPPFLPSPSHFSLHSPSPFFRPPFSLLPCSFSLRPPSCPAPLLTLLPPHLPSPLPLPFSSIHTHFFPFPSFFPPFPSPSPPHLPPACPPLPHVPYDGDACRRQGSGAPCRAAEHHAGEGMAWAVRGSPLALPPHLLLIRPSSPPAAVRPPPSSPRPSPRCAIHSPTSAPCRALTHLGLRVAAAAGETAAAPPLHPLPPRAALPNMPPPSLPHGNISPLNLSQPL